MISITRAYEIHVIQSIALVCPFSRFLIKTSILNVILRSSSMVRMPARKRKDTGIYCTAVLTVLDLNDSVLRP